MGCSSSSYSYNALLLCCNVCFGRGDAFLTDKMVVTLDLGMAHVGDVTDETPAHPPNSFAIYLRNVNLWEKKMPLMCVFVSAAAAASITGA